MLTLKHRLKKYARIAILMLVDLVIVLIAMLTSLALMNEMEEISHHMMLMYIISGIIFILCYSGFNLYQNAWQYATSKDYFRGLFAGVAGMVLCVGAAFLIDGISPRTMFVMSMLVVGGMMTVRLFYKIILTYLSDRRQVMNTKPRMNEHRILIVGAGYSGMEIIRELKKRIVYGEPVALIDDNPHKHGVKINDVPIVGGREMIPYACTKYRVNEILIAIPSGNRKDLRDIVAICQKTRLKVRTLPPLHELINSDIKVSLVKDIDVAQLLGRDEVELNSEEIAAYIEDEVVLVTGGGGSIGSEICRQVLRFKPKQLIIFDIYENTTYDLQGELQTLYGKDCPIEVLIGSVRDKKRLCEVFEAFHPAIVFHAAAHKHVPLMETSPHEAIKNNVYGTKNVAECADEYGAKSFILISTDKAVNPTSIMGASKRVAEMIIQLMSCKSKTKFSAVRFGNVLGSNGSVVPLFKRQIQAGGPVTVTDPEMERFFMTIPEAVQLVLQASTFAGGGEIYVLDMGEPVKIYDMAKELIRLSGFEPEKDIQIVFTGLRPGEKMYEELLINPDTQNKTAHEMVFVEKAQAQDLNIEQEIQKLKGDVSSHAWVLDEAEEVLKSIAF